MKAFEALAAQLAHLGVTDVFGLMGDGNLKLIPTLVHEYGIAVHAARHEAAAVAMAVVSSRVCAWPDAPVATASP